jgi:hypothetical protein
MNNWCVQFQTATHIESYFSDRLVGKLAAKGPCDACKICLEGIILQTQKTGSKPCTHEITLNLGPPCSTKLRVPCADVPTFLRTHKPPKWLPHQLELCVGHHVLHWGTGTGKTAGSLRLASLVMQRSRCLTIVCPETMLEHWQKSLVQFFCGPTIARVRIFGFSAAKQKLENLKNEVCIIDEVHHFRGKTPLLINFCFQIQKCKYPILLSATPIMATLDDRASLSTMLDTSSVEECTHVADVCLESSFSVKDVNVALGVPELLNFVTARQSTVTVGSVTFEQYAPNPYDTIGSLLCLPPKVQTAVELLSADGLKSACISRFLEKGLMKIFAILKHTSVPTFIVHGKMSTSARQKTIDDFNAASAPAVILLSPVAHQGVGLRNVKRLVLLEPGLVPMDEKQAIGRVVRVDSHDAPTVVEVLRLIAVMPQTVPEDAISALERIGVRKDDALTFLNSKLKLLTTDQVNKARNEGKLALIDEK